MKRSILVFFIVLFCISSVAPAFAQPAGVDFQWSIRGDDWEGLSLKVLPDWQISKGINTLIITNNARSFTAVIMLRYDDSLTVEGLREKIADYEVDYIYRTLEIVPITDLNNEYAAATYYFVKRFEKADMGDRPPKGEHAYVARALSLMNNLYLDVLVLTNDSSGPDLNQILSLLMTYIPRFGA